MCVCVCECADILLLIIIIDLLYMASVMCNASVCLCVCVCVYVCMYVCMYVHCVYRTEQNQLKDIKFDFVPGTGIYDMYTHMYIPYSYILHFVLLK